MNHHHSTRILFFLLTSPQSTSSDESMFVMRFIRLLNQLRDNLTGSPDAVTTRFGGCRPLSWASAEEAKQAINELVASGRDRMLL